MKKLLLISALVFPLFFVFGPSQQLKAVMWPGEAILVSFIFLEILIRKRTKLSKMLLGASCGVLAVIILFYSYNLFNYLLEESSPTLDENQLLDLSQYQPFTQDSKVAYLSGESTLHLEDKLPRIDCATALAPVISAFVQATYPQGDYNIFGMDDKSPVQCTGTIEAYDKLIRGKTDVVFAAGPSEEQRELAKESGTTLTLTPIGKEAFVFFVNSKNPVDGLTVEQIQGIYSGEYTNWKQVGGNNVPIRVFQREQNSGSQTALEKLMAGKDIIPPVIGDVVYGMEGIISSTSNTIYKNYYNAIGFSFRYYCTEMVKNKQIKLLKINGVYPDIQSIQDGTYPLSAQFYAVTAKSKNPNVQKLIDWVLSEQGQSLIEKTGYVPIR